MLTRKSLRQRFLLHYLLAAVGLMIVIGPGCAFADEPKPRRRSLLEELQRPPDHLGKPQPTAILESWWPNYPEWLATVAEIMAGNQLSASTGWYRKAVSQSRFEWKSIRDRFDANGDKRLTPSEIPLSRDDFHRLDLNRDNLLSAIDFNVLPQFEELSRVGSEYAFAAFIYIDRDHDGLVRRTELSTALHAFKHNVAFDLILESMRDDLTSRLDELTADPTAGLTLADFQASFELAARRGTLPARPLGDLIAVKASPTTLMTSFLKQDFGAWGPGPSLGESAPDFTLTASDGNSEVSFSNLIGEKPVVLIFGSFTCGPFRANVPGLEALTRRYKDRANFLIVYTRESHPTDGWVLNENRWDKVEVAQPRDFETRTRIAQTCQRSLKLDIPMVVDAMNDRVGRIYSGMPNRLYLIDRQGKIAYKGGRGPFGFKPYELEQSLVLLLHAESESKAKPAAPAIRQ